MAKSISMKNDLFRFVTVRTPNHLSQASKTKRFIYHPDISRSAISSCPLPGGEGRDAVFQQYLAGFQPVSSYKDIRNINRNVYDFSDELYRYRTNKTYTYTNAANVQPLAFLELLAVWDQLFYQAMARKSKYVRQACIQMIVADYVLRESTKPNFDWRVAANAKVIIPREVLDCYKPWLTANCKGELHGIKKLGIADFRRVEQEVCCYVPGEVSHIENILAREYKERSTRNLIRTEVSVETSQETEMEHLNDTTTATRNELHSEIANVLEEERSNNFGGSFGVTAGYKDPSMHVDANVTAYADFANSNSSSYSNTNAKTYAEELTKRALDRVVRKMSTKRTSKILKEFEENNKHGFDNRTGDKHVTGIYRWVDVIYTNRLINYGKRLMFEFMIPEPATFYKRMMNFTPTPKTTENVPTPTEAPEAPLSLLDQHIKSPTDINENNYAILAQNYGIQVSGPPDLTKNVSQAFSPNPPVKHTNPAWTQTFNITIPADYEAETFSGNYIFDYKSVTGTKAHFTCNVGGCLLSLQNLQGPKQTKSGNIGGTFASPKPTVSLPVVITGLKLYTYGVTVNVVCKLDPAKLLDWQTGVYTQLQDAYNNLMDQLANEQPEDTEQTNNESEGKVKSFSPAMNRIIEQRELKRACIDMVTRPFCRVMDNKLYEDINACGKYDIPKIKLDGNLDACSEQITFFEQAFDWQIMSYLFYPYYWAEKCDWGDLFLSQDEDLIFQAFKQAGMARVVVPIRPEFNEAVMYYLETGDIWLGGDLIVETEDDIYLSIAEELQTIEGVVEEEWETRMPTTLTLVQDKSAKLDEEGLPCCHEIIENSDMEINSIIPDSNILSLQSINNEPSKL